MIARGNQAYLESATTAMITAILGRRSAILAAALLTAAAVASPVHAGLLSVLNAPTQVLLTGDTQALTQALLVQDVTGVAPAGMAAPVHETPEAPPEPLQGPFWQFWTSQHVGLSSAPGMSSPSVLTSVGPSGGAPVAIAYWTFHNFTPPLTGRIIDRPHLILPTGPIFELLRPA
ncbi:hypothetical protein JCM17478_19900 [Thermopirellula anaerolimosa]